MSRSRSIEAFVAAGMQVGLRVGVGVAAGVGAATRVREWEWE